MKQNTELINSSTNEVSSLTKFPSTIYQSNEQFTSQSTLILTKEAFNSYLYTVNSFLSCKQYKTAIKFIQTKEEEFTKDQSQYYTIFNLKFKCYYKILDKKIISLKSKKSKQNAAHSNNSINRRLKSIERIIKKLKSMINEQITKIKDTKVSEMAKEIIIMNYCELLYHQARVSKIQKQTQDACAFLSIANNLLLNIVDYCKDPYTLSLYEQILLFMSVILIEDKSYFTAIEYNHINLKICLKEIMIRTINNDNQIYFHEYPDIMKHLSKIICNIISCFYHIGLCSEHLEEYIHSIESYKETRWFCMEFYSIIPYTMMKLMKETEKVCVQYYNYYRNKHRNIIRAKRRKTRINYAKIAKNKKLAQISSGVVSLEKYNALQSYLLHNQNDNTTKNKEAKTINSVSLFASDNRYKENGMLSSIVLYNDLLSKKYKQFLYESNDLNFNYLSRDASNKLEKYNIKLLSRSHIKQVLLAQDNNITTKKTRNQIASNSNNAKGNNTYTKELSSRSMINFHHHDIYNSNSSNRRVDKTTKQSSLCKNYSMSSLTNTTRVAKQGLNSSFGIYDQRQSRTPDRAELSKYLNKHCKKEAVPKYKVKDSYVFSKTFREKQRFIEKMENKEIKFQRNIIKLKNKDNYYLHKALFEENNLDIKKIEGEAEHLFKEINEKVNEEIKNKHKEYEPFKRNEELEQVLRKKAQVENCLFKSLDVKQIQKLQELEKRANTLRKEFSQKDITTTSNMLSNNSNLPSVPYICSEKDTPNNNKINKKNNQLLSTLNRDIFNCEQKYQYYEQLLHKKK